MTQEKLEQDVRQMPLIERLSKSNEMIAQMCKQGRPPKMTIPVQSDDEDFFIGITLRDAAEQLKQQRPWFDGKPPQEVVVAWLLLEVDEGLRAVRLGVFDDDGTWSEAGDWKGESYNNAIDSPIIGWMPFELPTPPSRENKGGGR